METAASDLDYVDSSSILTLAKHRRHNCSHDTGHARAELHDWGFQRVLITKPLAILLGSPICLSSYVLAVIVERLMCQRNIAYLNMYTYYTQVYSDSNFL